jgi:hypothetical protein
MNNPQPQQPNPQHGDTLPSALADIVQFLKRKRDARRSAGQPVNTDKQP